MPAIKTCCIRCGAPYTLPRVLADVVPEGRAKAFVNRYCAPCVAKLPSSPVIVERRAQ